MAAPLIPSEDSLFVARADWREVSEYPEASLRDPSIWAWELLRRNRSYARDYDALHHRVKDVPPTPFPKMPLDGYHCVPEALPDDTISSYLARHPDGTILPINDHIRETWGINELKDPNFSAIELATERSGDLPDNRLAWLFACNTVEVINPPTTWPTKNYLQFVRLSTLVSAHCTGTEMLVRLDFTGNLDEQL
ncbi:transcriptional regulator domain-containing protein [Pandoraea anhela]|uniref:Transcriptional regulator-like domain-containing protein n=1 Tax=Pandoraea anhela TaxID=2508295 RepID=A0A5E4Z6U1_9BURK|nr:DUF6499 domain-containing protein [Pandoraea anhela]VVE56155.1 hypothetical protein PAN31108_05071 [Pandoraea anhela]